jgi:aspartyl-tRNA(Asn)/glutamyl-tRNA(Gln) amidotransferase subunit A
VNDDDLRDLVDRPAARTQVSALELTEALLGRLEREQPRLRAMITITADGALEQAREADERRAGGAPLPLDGMPVVLKDNIDVARVPTTVGSRLFAGRVPVEDAEVTVRLRRAGAVILGKANMHELAFGATSANEAFGSVVNPAAPDRIPGGSSGGSGAAVAADLCLAAIGTDTGGSVRLPASLCGVSGLRPTYGAVPVRGIQPVAASLDTVGPLARAVTDLRNVLVAIAGPDPAAPTSRAQPLELAGPDDASGVCVGVVEPLLEAADPPVARCVESLVDVLAGLGASLVPVELPGWEEAVASCMRLIRGEATTVYGDVLASRPQLLEDGTRRRLAAGSMRAEDLDGLRRERARWTDGFEDAIADVDLVLLPTIAVEAPLASGADTVRTTDAVVPYTFLVAFAHAPGLSLPCGLTPSGAPVGAQLAAARGQDGLLLRVGAAVQAVTDWHRARA